MEKQILEGLNFGLIEHAQIVTCRVLPRIKKCLESELHLKYCSRLKFVVSGGLHSTVEAFLLPTQQPRIRILALPRFFLFTA